VKRDGWPLRLGPLVEERGLLKQSCQATLASIKSVMTSELGWQVGLCVVIFIVLLVLSVIAVRKSGISFCGHKLVKGRAGPDDDDIRENMINYKDDYCDGEEDQTGYDLSVLRMMNNGTAGLMLGQDSLKQRSVIPGDETDIKTFLQTNKERLDADSVTNPFDDLRHYAFEGDGKSAGSLSSLNSSTDEADLEFEYLPSFGPRFKKLADIYGVETDSEEDEEEEGGHVNPTFSKSSESWC